MILDILAYPDPRLSRASEQIGGITQDIRALAADMLETMYALRGIGLAAPQVGHALRLLVMDPARDGLAPTPRVFINPTLEQCGEIIVSEQEGCLSVPLNYRADIPRSNRVFLTAADLDGNGIAEEFSGFPAIVLQHEIDHLNGVLFIDHMSRLRRTLYDSRVKKWLNRRNNA
jgi:peptide deformylase